MPKATYVQRGEAIDYANPTDEIIAAGDIVALGMRAGVAGCDILPGAVGSMHVAGVFDVAKSSAGFAVAVGDNLFHTQAGAAAAGTVRLGWAVEPSPAGAEHVRVKLEGGAWA